MRLLTRHHFTIYQNIQHRYNHGQTSTFTVVHYYNVWVTFHLASAGVVAGHATAYQTPLYYLPKHSTSLQPWSNVDIHRGSLSQCMGNFSSRICRCGRRSCDCLPDTTLLSTKTFNIVTTMVKRRHSPWFTITMYG